MSAESRKREQPDQSLPKEAAAARRPLRVSFETFASVGGSRMPRRLWKLWSIRRHLNVAGGAGRTT
jgi:hypothetical protein